jgi:hypothetical protein
MVTSACGWLPSTETSEPRRSYQANIGVVSRSKDARRSRSACSSSSSARRRDRRTAATVTRGTARRTPSCRGRVDPLRGTDRLGDQAACSGRSLGATRHRARCTTRRSLAICAHWVPLPEPGRPATTNRCGRPVPPRCRRLHRTSVVSDRISSLASRPVIRSTLRSELAGSTSAKLACVRSHRTCTETKVPQTVRIDKVEPRAIDLDIPFDTSEALA